VAQKVGQIATARELEASWSKSQILEAYVNRVPWRGELVGINALSQTLFGKHASGLDTLEAAVAASLLRGPNASASVVTQRSCGVLQAQGASCVGVASLVQDALTRRGAPALGEQLAPHFSRQVLAGMKPAPARLTTSIDAPLQRIARDALRQQLAELSGRNVEDGAVLVLDNASGEVLAWVGSSGDLSDAAQVDGVLARRQPGSTLKPFVYGLAFEQRLITPASLIDDSPEEQIPLPNVKRPILEKVIDFCKYLKDH
jgi:penicillin-binding protein 1C